MKLTVLIDNNSYEGSCLISEHGLSFLIEDGSTTLLFDCGSTDAFIKNAYSLQVDLTKVTDIVLSHGHSDHIGGFLRLQALYEQFQKSGINFNSKRVLAHPNIFKPLGAEMYDGTMPLSKENIDKFFNLVLSDDSKYITKKLVYLGAIPINYGKVMRDYPKDETALAYKSKNGLIIFSGCSHSGLKNIIEHAKYITNENRINTVIGGLYLINRSEEDIMELGQYLQDEGVEHIYPCHCTDVEAKAILSKYVTIEEVCTGKTFEWA